jgi:hypothetical protein
MLFSRNSRLYVVGYYAVKHNLDKLRIIPQRNIYSLIQQNIRGGVVQCTRRYAKVNNKNEFILYLYVNNLYSHVMMFKLPTNLIWRINELPKNLFSWAPQDKRKMLYYTCGY